MNILKNNKLKALLFFLIFCLAVLMIGCREDEKTGTSKSGGKEPAKLSKDLNILVIQGGKWLPSLPKGYKVEEKATWEEVEKGLLEGGADLAVVSPTAALRLYEESEGNVLILSPVRLGGISVLYSGPKREERSAALLSGRRVVTAEEGAVSQYVLNQVIREDGGYAVAYDSVESYDEVAEALRNYDTFALVSEPCASEILAENENVYEFLSPDQLWAEKGHGDVPTWVIVTNKWKTEEEQDDMVVFKRDYEKALDKEKPGDGKVFYGTSNRGDGMVKEVFHQLADTDSPFSGEKVLPEDIFYNMKDPR